MKDKNRTKEQLIEEINDLRDKNKSLESLLLVQKQIEEKLREREGRYNTLFSESRDAIYIRNENGKFLEVNQAMLDVYGYTKEEILGMHVSKLYANNNDMIKYEEKIKRDGYVKDYEIKMRRKDGTEIYCMATATTLQNNNGKIIGYQGIIRDITERKISEAGIARIMEELRKMSLIDELTGLYNRRGFFSVGQKKLEISKRLHKRIFIIFIDLDNMKLINDTYGHMKGDQALMESADILRNSFREADVIARMGGDEFAIVAMENTETNGDILLSRLQKNIESHNNREKKYCKLSMSIGIVPCDLTQNYSLDTLLSRADSLMYENKKSKKLSMRLESAIH